MIRLEGVHKGFNGQQVLRGIDLEFRHGETTVVLGRSGCGKSVLLKLIIGLLPPDAGRVVVFGHDLSTLSRHRLEVLRMQFGMVFQGAALFDSLDVNDNVGFLLYEHSKLRDKQIREIVRDKLARVGLEGVESKMPEELSGGMRKRVALARAIAGDPHVILYDEPTTGLDPVTADTINDLIIRTQKAFRATSIVVTHDMASARKIADRMVMIHEGQIIVDDTPEAVLGSTDPRVQSFIYGDASLETGPAAHGGQS
ncbi:MAG: ABC transporter ATP-binding protein [Planctomycetes bacterium]|nr:ABC transporter ATP-binding protein [Planctomycetota bacterium]